MAERSSTLSSRDAKQAMKAAKMSMLSQNGTKQDPEVPDQSPSGMTSVAIVLITFVILSFVLWGLTMYLEIDMPYVEDAPKRMVYILRMHGVATIVIAIGMILHLLSPIFTSSNSILCLNQSVSQLALLAIINTTLASLEEEASKLIVLCLYIWMLGRFLAIASSFSAERFHSVASSVSSFPFLVVISLLLISLWEHGPCCGLDQIGRQVETKKESLGYFF